LLGGNGNRGCRGCGLEPALGLNCRGLGDGLELLVVESNKRLNTLWLLLGLLDLSNRLLLLLNEGLLRLSLWEGLLGLSLWSKGWGRDKGLSRCRCGLLDNLRLRLGSNKTLLKTEL